MKKIALLLIIIFLIVNAVYAQESSVYNSKNLIININVSSEAVINPESSDYNADYVNIKLSYVPYETFNQKVLDLDINPEAEIENNVLIFDFQNPEKKVEFGYNARIKTNNNIVEIKDKIKFPIEDLPGELKQYTQPSEIIDSNNEDIIGIASQLAQGEDDLNVVAHKIADWTKNNIEYDLSTLTVDISQKASWVLNFKQGVCDELTSLFIAMLRSLGIPAKFISGISYTNSSLFQDKWGSHGWAEVYFPGYGWIPYDVTYGEFGYIDPTHIKLKESIDSNEPSVQFKWAGKNIDLETKKLNIETSLEEKIGEFERPGSLDVSVWKQNIGFGSYNLIEVVLENSENYYVSEEIFISRPVEVEVIGEEFKSILLKPNERKNVFWIVKLTEDLQKNYIYTFPITIKIMGGGSATTSFRSSKNAIDYSLSEIKNVLEQKQEEEKKVYSRDVSISCQSDKKEFYTYEKALLECKIKNIGNIYFQNLNLCFEKECEKINLGITQEKNFNFSIESSEEGSHESVLSLKNSDVSKAAYIGYNILDQPEIKVNEIEFPENINYGDVSKISFLLSKQSASNPIDVEVKLARNNFENAWYVEELTENRRIEISNLLGKDLRKGSNEFNIIVKYKDRNGNSYESKENFVVELVNVTFFQNISLGFNQFVFWVENLFS